MPPPNILLIVTHDTGRHLGVYGRGVETPNLERLAAEGIVFDHAFCAAPQCSPSRASLLTGLVPHRHGLIGLTHRGFRLHPPMLERTLPALLRAAGYSTHLFGFQHEAPDAQALGYEQVVQPPSVLRHRAAVVTPAAVAFLESQPRQPFLAAVGFFETHRPFDPLATPREPVRTPPYLPDTPVVRRDIAELNGQVRLADAAIGQLLAALDRAGLADDTLVISTTDHGIAFPGAKGTLFDPGLEISLIMRGPGGLRGGRRLAALVSNVDILPTVLDLCGLAGPDDLDGVSLLPLARGERASVRQEVYAELTYHTTYDPMRGVRTERYKYIRSFAERPLSVPAHVDASPTKDLLRDQGYFTQRRPDEMLFDLHADPLERANCVGEPAAADVLVRLRSRLHDWQRATGDPLLAGDIPPPAGAQITPLDSYDP
jgi:arylsulfatase A-like enzyme